MAINHRVDSGYLARPSEEYYTSGIDGQIENRTLHRVVVHRFKIGDVDDPDVYAGEKLWEWQSSDAGQWVMGNSVTTPYWHRQMDIASYCYDYVVVATLTDVNYTYFLMRFK
jgi:hypothetical protein